MNVYTYYYCYYYPYNESVSCDSSGILLKKIKIQPLDKERVSLLADGKNIVIMKGLYWNDTKRLTHTPEIIIFLEMALNGLR